MSVHNTLLPRVFPLRPPTEVQSPPGSALMLAQHPEFSLMIFPGLCQRLGGLCQGEKSGRGWGGADRWAGHLGPKLLLHSRNSHWGDLSYCPACLGLSFPSQSSLPCPLPGGGAVEFRGKGAAVQLDL